MRKFVTIFFCISFCCGQSRGQELRIFESLAMYSKILKQEVKYSLLLPEGYNKSVKRYPVVYMLHGLGDDESSWLEYGEITQIADKAVKDKEIIPLIYVMPQGFRTYYVNDSAGTFLYQDMFVKELVPFIDSMYKTIPNKKNRATVGYSMGGFGALVLPLKHPELFTVCVPMSISIRTDSQYMTEESKGWNEQWGRLFGGIGLTGEARLTEYYKRNSPLPMIELQDKDQWKDLQIYIDNGDDEQTLSYSNEVLHQQLLAKGIRHEFRVRNGGHEFSFWRESLTNGLRFISDNFQGKAYRGDVETLPAVKKASGNNLLKTIVLEEKKYKLYLPPGFQAGDRKYPVIYVGGEATASQQELLANTANNRICENRLPPFLMIFLPQSLNLSAGIINHAFESKYRVRPGYRFRSLILFGKDGAFLQHALKPEQFTSCALIDASVNVDKVKQTIEAGSVKALERTWYFVSNTDKSMHSKANGDLHMLFKMKDIYHEYRVSETTNKPAAFNSRIQEIFQFTTRKMHR